MALLSGAVLLAPRIPSAGKYNNFQFSKFSAFYFVAQFAFVRPFEHLHGHDWPPSGLFLFLRFAVVPKKPIRELCVLVLVYVTVINIVV